MLVMWTLPIISQNLGSVYIALFLHASSATIPKCYRQERVNFLRYKGALIQGALIQGALIQGALIQGAVHEAAFPILSDITTSI